MGWKISSFYKPLHKHPSGGSLHDLLPGTQKELSRKCRVLGELGFIPPDDCVPDDCQHYDSCICKENHCPLAFVLYHLNVTAKY